MNMRIGHGYDVHRLVTGRQLVIGGETIPYDKGLLGHSDADVLVHAIIDAILGALGMGDIGKHFPDNNPAYELADSLQLLDAVRQMMWDAGYTVGNIDATILAEKPKMRPYIAKMEENVAKHLQCPKDQINIKATTEEGLGFTGKGEGISAHAVCLLVKI